MNNDIFKNVDYDALIGSSGTLRFVGTYPTIPDKQEYGRFEHDDLIMVDYVLYRFHKGEEPTFLKLSDVDSENLEFWRPNISINEPEGEIGINKSDITIDTPSLSATLSNYMKYANITKEELISEMRKYLEDNHGLTICDKWGF